jgi:hypothetical protein
MKKTNTFIGGLALCLIILSLSTDYSVFFILGFGLLFPLFILIQFFLDTNDKQGFWLTNLMSSLGFITLSLGWVFKIEHWEGGSLMLTVGLLLLAVEIISSTLRGFKQSSNKLARIFAAFVGIIISFSFLSIIEAWAFQNIFLLFFKILIPIILCSIILIIIFRGLQFEKYIKSSVNLIKATFIVLLYITLINKLNTFHLNVYNKHFIQIEENISKGAITQKENGDRVINDMQNSSSDAKLEQVQKDKIKIFLGVIKNIDVEAGKAIETIDGIKMELLTSLNENTVEEKKDGDGKILVLKKYNKSDLLTPGLYDLKAMQVKDVLVGGYLEKDIKDYTPSGQKLWTSLNTYRKRLTELTATYKTVDGNFNLKLNKDINDYKDNIDLMNQIGKLFSTSGNINKQDFNDLSSIYQELTKKAVDKYEGLDVDIHWIGRTFNKSPIVAAFASLSLLQMEVLSARAKAVKLLKSKI